MDIAEATGRVTRRGTSGNLRDSPEASRTATTLARSPATVFGLTLSSGKSAAATGLSAST